MGLKVEGSSPSIHPMNTKLVRVKLTQSDARRLKLVWVITLHNFLRFMWNGATFTKHLIINPLVVKSLTVATQRQFELNSLYDVKLLKTHNTPINYTLHTNYESLERRFINIFKVFVTSNLTTCDKSFQVHPSWFDNFFRHKGAAIHYINVYRFFTQWKRIYYLLFNIYYFQLRTLYFSNIFFKKEIAALN